MKRKIPEKKVCPVCGKEAERLCRYCPSCSANMKLSKDEFYKTASKRKKAAHLLSMLPLIGMALYAVCFFTILIWIFFSAFNPLTLLAASFLVLSAFIPSTPTDIDPSLFATPTAEERITTTLALFIHFFVLYFAIPVLLTILSHKRKSAIWAGIGIFYSLVSLLLYAMHNLPLLGLSVIPVGGYLLTYILQIVLWGLFNRDYKNYIDEDKTDDKTEDSEE